MISWFHYSEVLQPIKKNFGICALYCIVSIFPLLSRRITLFLSQQYCKKCFSLVAADHVNFSLTSLKTLFLCTENVFLCLQPNLGFLRLISRKTTFLLFIVSSRLSQVTSFIAIAPLNFIKESTSYIHNTILGISNTTFT